MSKLSAQVLGQRWSVQGRVSILRIFMMVWGVYISIYTHILIHSFIYLSVYLHVYTPSIGVRGPLGHDMDSPEYPGHHINMKYVAFG